MAEHADRAGAALTAADARQRAWRTLLQGLAVDALIAVVMISQAIVGTDVRWTAAYWGALGLMIAKTIVQTVVSSLARRLVPPAPLDS